MTHMAGSQIGNIERYDTGQKVDRQKRLTKGACRSEPLRSMFVLRDLPETVLKRKVN